MLFLWTWSLRLFHSRTFSVVVRIRSCCLEMPMSANHRLWPDLLLSSLTPKSRIPWGLHSLRRPLKQMVNPSSFRSGILPDKVPTGRFSCTYTYTTIGTHTHTHTHTHTQIPTRTHTHILRSERFRSLAKMYYQGTKAAICVFDTTVQVSRKSIMLILNTTVCARVPFFTIHTGNAGVFWRCQELD